MWRLSTPPAAITAGSSAAVIMVPWGPLSPEDSTTVTPAATAALSASARSAPDRLVGSEVLPNDSEITSACTVVTALSIPAMTWARERIGVSISDRSTSAASGASPLMVKVQPGDTFENGRALEYW